MIPQARILLVILSEEKLSGTSQDLLEETVFFQWMNLRSHIPNLFPVLPFQQAHLLLPKGI